MAILQEIKDVIENKNPASEKSLEKPRKVLIVEDEKILLDMYRDKFIKEDYEVITAENGEEGLEKAVSQKPDIILLDLMMPVMDGKKMLRKLREIPEFKKLPVIILTNAGAVENIRETQRFDNAVEFLIKSNVSVDEVVKKVAFWLPAIIR